VGFGSGDEQRQHTGSVVAGESPLGAYIRGEMAGTAMSFSMELTVPGQAQLPMAGVSYVAVHPLRRRSRSGPVVLNRLLSRDANSRG
jgi:GNAT acetyltransferase-like protein